MNSGFFGAAVHAARRLSHVLPFWLTGAPALAAQQAADPALPAAPGAALPAAGASGAALSPPPSLTSSALAGASNLSFSWGGYFEALAILCFALAALWALLWLVKRRGGGALLGNTAGMRVESRLAVAPKKWVLIVRCLDRRLVLGLTDENITLLTEIPPENSPAGKTAASAGAGDGGNAALAGSGAKNDAGRVFASLLKAGKENGNPAA